MASLEEFAAEHGPKRSCVVCDLPEDVRVQVDKGKKNGIPYRVVHEWLLANGHQLTKNQVQRHGAGHD